MAVQRPKPKVGNEFSGGRPGVLDLRQAKPKPKAVPKHLAYRPIIMPAAEVIQRSFTPPVRVTFNPVKITKTEAPTKKSFLDGFAYDLLFIAVAFFVALATPFRDWLFLAYLVAALGFRVSSQRIFRSALFCLVLIPVLTQLKRSDAADSFAIFTFYFLCIGVIRAIVELRKDS